MISHSIHFFPSHVSIYSSYAICASADQSLLVHSLSSSSSSSSSSDAFLLSGHTSPVLCVSSFSSSSSLSSPPYAVASVSDDTLILTTAKTLSSFSPSSSSSSSSPPTATFPLGCVISLSSIGMKYPVRSVSFSPHGTVLCLHSSRLLVLFSLTSLSSVALMESAENEEEENFNAFTATCFIEENLMLTCEKNKRIRVWSITQRSMIFETERYNQPTDSFHQIHLIPAPHVDIPSPNNSSSSYRFLCLNSDSGVLSLYSLILSPDTRSELKFIKSFPLRDLIAMEEEKLNAALESPSISSSLDHLYIKPSTKSSSSSAGKVYEKYMATEENVPVFSSTTDYAASTTSSSDSSSGGIVGLCLLPLSPSLLFLVNTSSCFLFNINNGVCSCYESFLNEFSPSFHIGLISSASAQYDKHTQTINIAATSPFKQELYRGEIRLDKISIQGDQERKEEKDSLSEKKEEENPLKLINSSPIATTSKLKNTKLTVPAKPSSSSSSFKSSSSKSSSLVFHKNIKSSGYGLNTKKAILGKPDTTKGKEKTSLNKSNNNNNNSTRTDPSPTHLSSPSPRPIVSSPIDLSSYVGSPLHNSCIVKMCLSSDDSLLSCCSLDHTSSLTSLPFSRFPLSSVYYTSHQKPVRWIDLSANGEYQLTAESEEGIHLHCTTKNKENKRDRQIMKITPGRGEKESLVSAGISHTGFFLGDKLITATHSNHFSLFKWNIDIRHTNSSVTDLKSNYSHCKHLYSYDYFGCNSFTSTHHLNRSDSRLVFLGVGGEKSIQIIDLEAGKRIRTIAAAHQKCINSLRANIELNVIASAGEDSSLKLFDLNSSSSSPSLVLTGHLNRTTRIQCNFSPCNQYISIGSEDNCVYLYDTRYANTFLKRLSGSSDIVTEAMWRTKKNQLIAVGYDGKIRAYGEETQTEQTK